MDYKQLSKISDSFVKDDVRSEQRLHDLLNGPHANDIRYYFNQLDKCSEDKRRERVQTWVEILKQEKPDFAAKIIEKYSDYLSEEQVTAENERKTELERQREEEARLARERAAKEKEHKQQSADLFKFVCEFLKKNDRLTEVARRNPKWNSLGGRIGSYSHAWTRPDGRKISDIYALTNRYDDLLVNVYWHGGYDYDFGVNYEGGSVWKWERDWSNMDGSYDSDEYVTLYKVKRCPRSLIQSCVKEATEKFTALSQEEIQAEVNKIIQ